MKIFALLLSMALTTGSAFAQWNFTGVDQIINTNSGDVLIGTTSSLRLYGKLLSYHPKSNFPMTGEIMGTSNYWGFRTDTDNRFHIDIYHGLGTSRSALSVDQTGNVGVGITSASAQLHLASNLDHAFKITRASGMYGFRIFRNAQQGQVFFQNTDDNNVPGTRMLINEGGGNWANLMLNPDGGNVGVGTHTPWNTLHVVGQPGDSGTGLVRLDGTGANASMRIGINTDYAWIQTHNSRPLYINDFGNNTILNNQHGRVGIGNPNPGCKLDVVGDAGNAASGNGVLQVSATGAISSMRLGVDSEAAWIQSFGNKPVVINELGNNTILNPIYGNVGIGTTTPGSFKLAVNGKIWTQEVNVAMTNPGPDYVFESDYDLKPLSEVESYIKANKHLPEVPSAKEMEEEGLNLKEMNLLLLKKVEELTLHLIEQEKKIAELSKRSVSPDFSVKKVEELTVHMITQDKKLAAQADVIEHQNKRLEKLEKDKK